MHRICARIIPRRSWRRRDEISVLELLYILTRGGGRSSADLNCQGGGVIPPLPLARCNLSPVVFWPTVKKQPPPHFRGGGEGDTAVYCTLKYCTLYIAELGTRDNCRDSVLRPNNCRVSRSLNTLSPCGCNVKQLLHTLTPRCPIKLHWQYGVSTI